MIWAHGPPRCYTHRMFACLTAREWEVFVMWMYGWTARQTAERLGIATRTVETHRYNTQRALGIPNRMLVARAYWLAYPVIDEGMLP